MPRFLTNTSILTACIIACAIRIVEVSLKLPLSLRMIPNEKIAATFFAALSAGVEDFVQFAGGISSFYGISATETVRRSDIYIYIDRV